MDTRLFLTLTAFTAFLGLVYLVHAILAPFIMPVIWAGAIGIATFPFYDKIRTRIGAGKNVSAAAMTAIAVIALVVPVVSLLFFLVQEMTQVYKTLDQMTENGGAEGLRTIQTHPWVAPWVDRVKAFAAALKFDIRGMILAAANRATSLVLAHLTDIVKNFFAFFIRIIVMVITLFFIYRDGDDFRRQFRSIIPLRDESREILLGTVRKVLVAVIYGVFLTCIIQGILGGFSFWFVGLPSPILFGAMMAVAALVPAVGTALVWVPAAGYLFLQGDLVRGGILVAWSILVVSSIDNLIRPLFISGKAEIPLLIVALGALGGLAAFGFTGILVGPIVLAVFKGLIDIYRKEKAEKRLPL